MNAVQLNAEIDARSCSGFMLLLRADDAKGDARLRNEESTTQLTQSILEIQSLLPVKHIHVPSPTLSLLTSQVLIGCSMHCALAIEFE